MADPTVILIGGPPGAGKSTLARSVAAGLGYASTTIDDLVSTARWFADPQQHPDLHRMNVPSSVEYFTEGPPDRLIADAGAMADTMWPVLERLMGRHRDGGDPVVFDWWLFDPDRVAPLGPSVGSLWLTIDPGELDRREWALASFRHGSSDPERMHQNFMARSLWRNRLTAERAAALGLPVLHQSGHRSVEDLTAEALGLIGASRP